jgi:type I restriction enzyme S subunit
LVGPEELVINLTAQSLADDFLGRVSLTGPGEVCLLNQRIARLSPVLLSPRYLLYVFKSPWFRQFVAALNTGSLIQHMFTSQLADFAIPVPPLDEQERIADDVDRLLSIAEVCEDSALRTQRRSRLTRQAVLRRAFEGRLVEQKSSDEPADVLLARIRAERAVAPVANRKQKRSRNLKAAS